jgi:quinoprotein glucose dehydrogenase
VNGKDVFEDQLIIFKQVLNIFCKFKYLKIYVMSLRKNPFSIILCSLFVFTLSFFSCKNETKETTTLYPKKGTQISATLASNMSSKIRKEVNAEIADGLELTLWAADTLVNDPVAISVDENGKIYYTLGSRLEHSEFDIRAHRDWMTASISFQTVEDRRAFIKKTFSEQNEQGEKFLKDLNEDGTLDWRDLTVEKEQVWVVADNDEDGLADNSHLYIEDFHEEITDIANGVEYFDGEVFLSVGPDLWKIKDNDGDGIADQKESISHGYTIHIAFGAHGMSGVTVGPQGRIWWGTGDIGTNVVDKNGKRWKYPNQGAIVRSDPDGSNFEVYAAGLRNTHEFVFDEYGNLISEDNDGDHEGERERLVYLINGSDTGWRINWQFGKYTDPDNNGYKVWMDEKMGIPRWDGQAAYFLPPIQNYVNGPTGMVYNPGTALGEQWYNHFFIAEFRGTPANSPIHAFTLKPKGATFELNKTQEVAKGLLPTGLDFGPDGALYFGDWIDGWGVKNEGRIWKLDVPGEANSAIRKQVKQLIGSDFSKTSLSELGQLLSHQDMRIRRKAQFELVKRGEEGFNALLAAANQKTNQLGRIHGIWGIAQMARTKDMKYAASLLPFLQDEDDEIITQAAKMLGDVKYAEAGKGIIPLLKNPSLRVQLHAAEALGRIEYKEAVQPILDMLLVNNDEDAWLRHAGMIALARINEEAPLIALQNHESRALRIAAVVALRRMESEGVAKFLQDKDEYVVTEAARAINDDFSIEGALPNLAQVLKDKRFKNEALIRRAINAALRVGKAEDLDLLLNYAKDKSAPPAMRAEAVAALSTWAKPSPLDRVDGRYRGEVTREEAPVKDQLQTAILNLLNEQNSDIQIVASKAIGKLNLANTADALFNLVKNSKSKEVKTAALFALDKTKASTLDKALEIAINDKDKEVRSTALEILPGSSIEEGKAVKLFEKVLTSGSSLEQQATLAALGSFKGEAAVNVLGGFMDQLSAGTASADIQLDILEAVTIQANPTLLQKLKAYEDAKPKDSKIADFIETLSGGNSNKGRDVFYNNEAAQCVRCHTVFEYGGNAGPVLAGVGDRLSKEKILESLVDPSAVLAAGYGVASLELKSGEIISGVVQEETAEYIKLKIGKEDIKEFAKNEITKREDIPSSMPPVGTILKKKEIRDLLAFLSGLKDEQ